MLSSFVLNLFVFVSVLQHTCTFIALFWLIGSVVCDLPRGTKRNTYLPPEPTKGYKYMRPSVPFPKPSTNPSSKAYPRPTSPTVSGTFTHMNTGTGHPYNPRPTVPGFSNYPSSPTRDNGITHDYQDHGHHEPGMPFDFKYAVKEDAFGNDYAHNAISDGDIVHGEYRVQLPDGRVQVVRYTADWKHGFSAQVSYNDNFNPGY